MKIDSLISKINYLDDELMLYILNIDDIHSNIIICYEKENEKEYHFLIEINRAKDFLSLENKQQNYSLNELANKLYYFALTELQNRKPF